YRHCLFADRCGRGVRRVRVVRLQGEGRGMGNRRAVVGVVMCVAVMLGASVASAQVQTGSIAGSVSDTSGALLPGVSVTLTGERLIGGPQVQVTDATGSYRFDRLSPGSYAMKFELQGFRTLDRTEILVSA